MEFEYLSWFDHYFWSLNLPSVFCWSNTYSWSSKPSKFSRKSLWKWPQIAYFPCFTHHFKHNYGTSQFLMGISTINGHFQELCNKLPEGIQPSLGASSTVPIHRAPHPPPGLSRGSERRCPPWRLRSRTRRLATAIRGTKDVLNTTASYHIYI